MFGLKTLNRHAALMNRMAQVLGVDLTHMMAAGRMSGEEWREAVVRCACCDDPAACQHWLAQCPAPELCTDQTRPDAAPQYCNNREMMAQLRVMLAEETQLAEALEGENDGRSRQY